MNSRISRRSIAAIFFATIAAFALPVASRAETDSVTFAKQFGVAFLPLAVLERDKLVEKHAKALGLGDLKVNFAEVAGPSVINDGLLSGTVTFAAIGMPSLIQLWSKTKDTVAIKAIGAVTTYPLYLNVRNPSIKSVKDFTDKDRIVVPSVKVSTQAILLQMEAAKLFGQENYAKLDPLTIGLSHPDGLLALRNQSGGVDAHFTSSPYHEEEMKIPGVHTIITSYQIMGGPATALTMATTSKFHEANPKTTRAVRDALAEAIQIINRDKRAAASYYVSLNRGTTETPEQVFAMISAKGYEYTLAPAKLFATAEFMHRIGTVKEIPSTWKEYFFPEAQGVRGN